ncbi:MAG TPA: histidine kinase [Trebonia sp.]|jgi:signal transduction histidine kinase|nr:histidine kinase [Trebonia sp.]
MLDSLVAVLVLLVGLGTVRAGAPSDIFGRRVTSVPVAVVVATAVAQTLPLAWRRRAPLTVFWVVLAVCLLQVSLRLALRTDISLMIALYGVARYAPVRRRSVILLAGAGTVTGVVLVIFRVPHLQHSTLFVLFFLCCAAAASAGLGLAGRARQAQLIAMSDRAARLETERDQRAKIATATERARVSREMHDIVGHNLAVIIGLADGGSALAPASPERAAEAMRLIAATGRQALSELRLTLGALRERPPGEADAAGEPGLRPQPGAAELPGLLDRIRAAGPRVTYTTSGDLAALAPGLQLTVYRIAQEALTNALRHAGAATEVQVTLHTDPRAGQVRITVEDTGPPSGSPAQAGGFLGQPGGPRARTDDGHDGQGLTGIRERASLLGGTARAGPRPGGGWAVHAALPVPATPAVPPVSAVPPDPAAQARRERP